MISVSQAIWMILRSARVGRSESASCPPPLASASHTAVPGVRSAYRSASAFAPRLGSRAAVPDTLILRNTALRCEPFSSVPRGTRDYCGCDLCGGRRQHLKPNHPANPKQLRNLLRRRYLMRASTSARRRCKKRCAGPALTMTSAARYESAASLQRPSRRNRSARAAHIS